MGTPVMTPDEVGALADEGEANNWGLPRESANFAGSLLPTPPASQGRPPRDILKDILGSERGQVPPSLRGPSPGMEPVAEPPDTAGIMGRLNRGGDKVLFSDATGTNAAIEGDLNYQRIKNERDRLDLESAFMKHKRDEFDPEGSDDALIREIAGAKKAHEYEQNLPVSYDDKGNPLIRRPTARVSRPGGQFSEVIGDVIGAPSYGESQKYQNSLGVAQAHYGGMLSAREQALQQWKKDEADIDAHPYTPADKQRRKDALTKKYGVLLDEISGKGVSGVLSKPDPWAQFLNPATPTTP